MTYNEHLHLLLADSGYRSAGRINHRSLSTFQSQPIFFDPTVSFSLHPSGEADLSLRPDPNYRPDFADINCPRGTAEKKLTPKGKVGAFKVKSNRHHDIMPSLKSGHQYCCWESVDQ
ncbi:Hypothetical protein NTJ_13770 [Nesidiocoris tenuis]|uniref:Uncharacterized protein n=1 Tax=Nesidiocoris tenuis TaxID=355587 RepID=A0ABN7B9H8_9HEMI|nr:Hypothetical protein NTJ_13770 [Nesidiocoris tenuis]